MDFHGLLAVPASFPMFEVEDGSPHPLGTTVQAGGVNFSLYRDTQFGNNNAYCQDNEVGWLDWRKLNKNPDLLRFWKRIISFRKRHATLRKNAFFIGEVNTRGLPDVSWHGPMLNSPAWGDGQARALGFTHAGFEDDPDIHVMMNMYWEALDMAVPVITGRRWTRAVDTSLLTPLDIADPGTEEECSSQSYRVNGRSIVILVNRPGNNS